jgi:glycosyltransferase involved in cell wall biosynthesis
MALALAAAGRSVEVWCPAHPELARREWPFTVVPLPNRGTQGWRCRRATAAVWRERAGAVRDATVWLAEPGALLTAFYDFLFRLPAPRRLVLTLHGSEILNFTRWPHRRVLFNRLLARASVVSVLSRFNARLLAERASVPSEKIRLVPGAVRSDFLPEASVSLPHGDGTGAVVVACVARIHPRKGQAALLEAAWALPEALRRRLRFRFAGRVVDGAYQARLEKLAGAVGVEVAFMGEVPDAALAAFYAQSDIFALTSVPLRGSIEGFGLVYLEAGACGLPVLAHDTGGVSDAVLDGETGLLVASGDRQALASALARLVESAELRRRLGEGGRHHAAQFSWEKSASALFAEQGRAGD